MKKDNLSCDWICGFKIFYQSTLLYNKWSEANDEVKLLSCVGSCEKLLWGFCKVFGLKTTRQILGPWPNVGFRCDLP
jgi:hypothetical protein